MSLIVDNSWSLIEKGMFGEAINKATEEYNSTSALVSLRHRALASLLIKDYQAALEDFKEVLSQTDNLHKGDAGYIDVGMVYWLIEDYTNAEKYWMDSMTLKLRYTSNIVSPPAIVYFAGIYLKNRELIEKAIKYLKRRWKSKIQLAGFLLDEINESDLLNTIKVDSPLKQRTLCKYEFYIAIKCLQKGYEDEYLKHLERCISAKGNYLEFEYFIALEEVCRFSA